MKVAHEALQRKLAVPGVTAEGASAAKAFFNARVAELQQEYAGRKEKLSADLEVRAAPPACLAVMAVMAVVAMMAVMDAMNVVGVMSVMDVVGVMSVMDVMADCLSACSSR